MGCGDRQDLLRQLRAEPARYLRRPESSRVRAQLQPVRGLRRAARRARPDDRRDVRVAGRVGALLQRGGQCRRRRARTARSARARQRPPVRRGARRVARGGGREPRQGRVRGDARPRAAQPARADRHLARGHGAPRGPGRRTRARHHRASGRAPLAHGRRPARRLAHRVGQGRAAPRARRPARRDQRALELTEPGAAGRRRHARGVAHGHPGLGRRRCGAADADDLQPDHQRGQVLAHRAADRDRAAAATATAPSCASRQRRRHRAGARCRASSTASSRASRRWIGRAAASASAWRSPRTWSSCTAARSPSKARAWAGAPLHRHLADRRGGRGGAAAAGIEPASSPRPTRILVVDDNDDAAQSLATACASRATRSRQRPTATRRSASSTVSRRRWRSSTSACRR